MGFWDWLTGKTMRVPSDDKIWLTGSAKRRALCRLVQQQLASGQPVILLAHFPSTLSEIADELAQEGVPYSLTTGPISTNVFIRLTGRGAEPSAHLALAKQLRPDPFPGVAVGDEGLTQILVAERHFARESDDVISDFANGLGTRCHIVFHLSLDDPLVKAFAGEMLIGTLRRLGIDESSPIESVHIVRRILSVQKKFAGRAQPDRDANSAEEWLEAEYPEEGGRPA